MKIKLYLDFDGVILNTIDITYKEIEKLNLKTRDEYKKYYREIDWAELMRVASPINDSINNIKKIINSNLYDTQILTHVNSQKETDSKIDYVRSNGLDINIIAIDLDDDKSDAVNPYNCILVDDYIGNLDKWAKKGGIPVKFSNKNKKYDYITISSLDELITRYDEIKKVMKY